MGTWNLVDHSGSTPDDDDCGDYARSVASNEEREQDESSISPHAAAVVADRWFVPPQVTEAPDEWENMEWSYSPAVAAGADEGRFIPPLAVEA